MHELNEIYKSYNKDIVGICFHYLGNIQEAEEVAQDVFIKCSKFIDTFASDINIKAWLCRVAINRCFDKKRHLKVVWQHMKHLLANEDHKNVICNSQSKLELSDELVNALSCVDKKAKMILILKFMEEMSYDEISEVMSISVGTLKSKVSRSLKKIRLHSEGNL